MYGTNHTSKETLYRKEKEVLILTEKIDSLNKNIKVLNLTIQQNEEEKLSMNSIKTNLDSEIEGLRSKMKGIED